MENIKNNKIKQIFIQICLDLLRRRWDTTKEGSFLNFKYKPDAK